MKEYTFPCGCHFPIISENPLKLDFSIYNNPFNNCPAVWNLFAEGKTYGVFQLESRLGKTFCKKLKPESRLNLAALSSILRPGTLKAIDDKGVSMTSHYCYRKNGEEPCDPIDEALRDILKDNYGVLTYQEEILAIGQKLAGFSPTESDKLRQAVGKKDAQLMSETRKKFIEGAIKVGIIDEARANLIFDNIQKSARYLFNKSHACAYGLTGYETAYLKTHWPAGFYTTWIGLADWPEEIENLVEEAKSFNVEVSPPLLTDLSNKLVLEGNNIRFGLDNIKKMGDSHIRRIKEAVSGLNLKNITWYNFLCQTLDLITPSLLNLLIKSGSLRFLKVDRSEMLYEAKILENVSGGEKDWIKLNWSRYNKLEGLLEGLAKTKKEGGGCHSEDRVNQLRSQLQLLRNPPYSLKDSAEFIIQIEKDLLGIALTYSPLDGKNTFIANCNVKEYKEGTYENPCIAVELKEVNVIKSKRGKSIGKNMAFMKVGDETGVMDDVIVFSDAYEEFSSLLFQGNLVLLKGKRSKNRDSFVVSDVFQVK